MLALVAAVYPLALSSSLGVTTVGTQAERIAAELGTKITVERSLSKELVFVSGGHLRGMDLLKAVSSAVHASVASTPGGFRVERTMQDREELQKQRLAIRSKWIGDQIAQLQAFRSSRLEGRSLLSAYTAELDREHEAMRRFSDHTGPFPETYFAQELLPSETLVESLVKRIGAKRLADVPTGETRVFEDLPVDGAEALPPHEDLLDAYVRDSAGLQSAALPAPTDPNSRYFGRPGVRPAKLRLSVFSALTTVAVTMDGYDANGARVVAANFATLEHNPIKAPPTVAAEVMADPHAEWTNVRESAEAVLASSVPSKFGVETPELLLRPDEHEPLNLFASDVLDGMAAQNPDRTTVVDASDEFWFLARVVHRNGRMCVTAFEKVLDQCEDYERIDGPGAVIWRPKDPDYAESNVADRRVLAKTARAILEGKEDLLREVSLGYHNASRRFDPRVQLWFNFALWQTDLKVTPLPPEPVCRLLGAISDSDWDELLAGRTLTLGSLLRDEEWNVLANDVISPGGRPLDSDIQQHALELYDRNTLGETRLSLRTESSLAVRSWLGTEDRKWWGDIADLTREGPGHTVTSQKPLDEWGRPEFEVLMGGGRLIRYANAVNRIAVFSLPYRFHADFRCRVGYSNVSEPVVFTDLPKEMQDEALLVWQRERAAAAASLRPTEPNRIPPPKP